MDVIKFSDFNVEALRKHAEKGQLVVILGTGFTMGLAESSISWDGLLRELRDYKRDILTSQQAKDLEFLVTKDHGKDCDAESASREFYTAQLLAAGYMIRDVLYQNDFWDDAIKEIFKKLEVNTASRYAKFLTRLGKLHGKPPLVMTTNYDDLIARTLGWKVMYQDRRGKIEMKGPIVGEQPSSYLKGLSVAGQFIEALGRGWLKESDRFVFHLHGWSGAPDSIVLDPADYERYAQASVDLILEGLLRNNDRPVLFIGMGDGILDPHFMRFWAQKDLNGCFPENYWILLPWELSEEEGEENKVRKWEESVGPDETRLKVIRCEINEISALLEGVFPV